MYLQGRLWNEQGRVGEARSEALCAIDAFEKVRSMEDLRMCRVLLRNIEKEMEEPISSGGLGSNGELPGYSATPQAY